MNSQSICITLPESIIIQLATLSEQDRRKIQKCRGNHNRLGFAYQLMFVKVFNHFPNQVQLEIQSQLLTFACLQFNYPHELFIIYQKRRQTIAEHQEQIRIYLQLAQFDKAAIDQINSFLFIEAQRVEHTSILLAKAESFLKEQQILQPARGTLERLIVTQRQKAREFIYAKMLASLTEVQCTNLDNLLIVTELRISALQQITQPPAQASPKALR